MFFRFALSVTMLIMSLVFLVETFSLRTMASSDPGGPAMFPRFLIAVTIPCALIELIRIARAAEWPAVKAGVAEFFSVPVATKTTERLNSPQRVVAIILLSALYPLVLLKIGFILATTLFAMATAIMLRVAPLKATAMGAIISVGIFILFAQLLDVRVPPGQWFDIKDLFIP